MPLCVHCHAEVGAHLFRPAEGIYRAVDPSGTLLQRRARCVNGVVVATYPAPAPMCRRTRHG